MTEHFGCVEFCLPGTLEDKLETLDELGLWLELVNISERDLSILSSFSIDIRSVQAYRLHDLHLLSRDKYAREAATMHIKETIGIAREVGAANVIAVPTYGFDLVSAPFKTCVETFRELSSESDVNILVEALSPTRSAFSPSLAEVSKLVKAINRDNVALAADTCHIHEGEKDVISTLMDFRDEIVELHLKDSCALPPGKGELDFTAVLEICENTELCLEFMSEDPADLKKALGYLKSGCK
ncbi:MAG: TIM barrel protein [Candidatus Hydrothermarchaeales archaeon]